MPYNYTVSEFNFTEALQDAVYAGNMITGGSVTITPNPGYVVSASSFSAAGTLPAQFSSISFTDTAVAGEINNTVTVTFVFSALFEMSSAANIINLPISGHADLIDDKREITIDVDFIDNTIENVNGEVAVGVYSGVASTITETPETETIINGIQTSNLSGTIDAENNIAIATILVNSDTNYHFDNLPTISVENAPQGASFSLQLTNTVSENSDGQPTHLSYKLKVNSSVSIPSGLGCKVFIHYTGVSDRDTVTTSKKEIKEIIYGSPEIPIGGATKRIQIVGDVGAEFDLTITKNSDNTSIMSTTLANADIIHNPAGLIRGLNKTLTTTDTNQLLATFEFEQIFPSASANEIYHINVTPKGSTILNANLTQTAPQGIIYQYINPTITLRGLFSGSGGVPPNITYTGRPNKEPSKLKHIKTVAETFQINYQLTHGSAINKASTITWSSTGTSSWANSAYDSSTTTPANHGNHIEIVNIVHTATGATTASLTADVIVKKFGTKDVAMTIDLDTFFTI